MELIRPYDSLAADYSQNARRNIRKAMDSGVTVKRKVDPEDLINLFRENFGKQEGVLQYQGLYDRQQTDGSVYIEFAWHPDVGRDPRLKPRMPRHSFLKMNSVLFFFFLPLILKHVTMVRCSCCWIPLSVNIQTGR